MIEKNLYSLADIVDGKPNRYYVKTSILLLMRMMQAHFQKPVILLLDEYDVAACQSQRKWLLSTDAGTDEISHEYSTER